MTIVVSALVLGTPVLQAQETNELEQLRKEMREMRKLMQQLEQKIETLERKPAPAAPPPAVPAAPATEPAPAVAAKPWSPADPIRLGSGQNYIGVSFDGLFAAGSSTANDIGNLQLGGHDPAQRGFTVQNLETVFDGRVDPYFRGQANIIMFIDPEGETVVEVEEAYLETLSLPLNLQVKAGQFFTEFGRLNPSHPHSWSFVDQPLVNGRFFGADGLRNAGARLSWLTPTPFYSELFFTIQNSHGETATSFRDRHEDEVFFGRLHSQNSVKTFNDLLFVPRYVASFNLSDSQTLLAGASAAFGPNGSGTDTDTQIYGVDLLWKWKSPQHHGGFPFVSWQTEAMLRRFKAGAFSNIGDDTSGDGVVNPGTPDFEFDLYGDGSVRSMPRETLTDYGLYSQVLYGFRKGWVAGLRGDWVSSDGAQYEMLFGRDAARASRWRLSPNLTWYPSEFSKIRLQYNYDRRTGIGDDHSVWLQFEFLLGSHAAHKF